MDNRNINDNNNDLNGYFNDEEDDAQFNQELENSKQNLIKYKNIYNEFIEKGNPESTYGFVDYIIQKTRNVIDYNFIQQVRGDFFEMIFDEMYYVHFNDDSKEVLGRLQNEHTSLVDSIEPERFVNEDDEYEDVEYWQREEWGRDY
jgi:hypothetical protein